jgi:O-antigen ligase
MMIESSKIRIFPLAAAGTVALLVYLSLRRPYLFDGTYLLGLMGLILAGFLAVQYETYFWNVFAAVFLWAGSAVPLAGQMQQLRWAILGFAAFLALAYYGRNHNRIHFNYLHLLALFTVVAVSASALVSVNPLMTLLKSLSLAALFIYGVIGVRVVWAQNPEPFLQKLSQFVEGLTYFTGGCYALSFTVWGNPNSLGVITGVICWPILLWKFVLAKSRREYLRRGFALAICGYLLVWSESRASMLAALLSGMLFLISARRYRMVLVGIGLSAVALTMLYLVAPERVQSARDNFLYKKAIRNRTIMQSRQEPWEKSINSFREHPWLGFGFGVAETSADWQVSFHTPAFQTRERGSSYLTFLEGTGLIGAIPLFFLILALGRDARKVFRWLRQTGHVNHPSVPAACFVVGALFHAAFEDWLLAVGYYMSAIFWVIAFSLRDWMACPVRSVPEEPVATRQIPAIPEASLVLR